MNNWGANRRDLYGHIGGQLITLASMLRIGQRHNVPEGGSSVPRRGRCSAPGRGRGRCACDLRSDVPLMQLPVGLRCPLPSRARPREGTTGVAPASPRKPHEGNDGRRAGTFEQETFNDHRTCPTLDPRTSPRRNAARQDATSPIFTAQARGRRRETAPPWDVATMEAETITTEKKALEHSRTPARSPLTWGVDWGSLDPSSGSRRRRHRLPRQAPPAPRDAFRDRIGDREFFDHDRQPAGHHQRRTALRLQENPPTRSVTRPCPTLPSID